VAAFADFWGKLSRAVGHEPGIAGYGLMNEPIGIAGGAEAWEEASRQAVSAIRENGDAHRVFVPSYEWGGVSAFARHHRRGPWIRDGNVWYEGHHYFDSDGSSHYRLSFDQEVARARGQGFRARR
jgi:aryl-phospho-beta-D-glucosidase BglC (GH1 family)